MRILSTVLALACLAGAGCVQAPPVHLDGLYNSRATRAAFRPDGYRLYSSNYYTLPTVLPAGSPAKVTRYSATSCDMEIQGTRYTMVPMGAEFATDPTSIQAFLDKYFVDRKEDLNLDAMGPAELKDPMVRGQYVISMTKEQVYTAMGPPVFIDGNIATAGSVPRDRIMQSNRWTYPYQWVLFPIYVELIFADNILREQK